MPSSPIAGLPYPATSAIPDVPADLESLAAALDIVVVPSFASATARDAAITSPSDGQLCYLADMDYFTAHINGSWVSLATAAKSVGTSAGTLAAGDHTHTGSSPETKILASDQTISATSATDVPGMSVTVGAGTYEVNFSLYGITGATGGSGLTFSLAASGGITTAAYHGMKNASAINWISGTSTLTEGFTPGGSSQPFWLFGRQVMTVGAGAISLQAYRSTSNATVKATLTNMTVTPTS